MRSSDPPIYPSQKSSLTFHCFSLRDSETWAHPRASPFTLKTLSQPGGFFGQNRPFHPLKNDGKTCKFTPYLDSCAFIPLALVLWKKIITNFLIKFWAFLKGFWTKCQRKNSVQKQINCCCPDFLLCLPTHSNTVVEKRDFYPITIGRNISNWDRTSCPAG